jgi:tetratricopeptide (TPR) repeat protein
MAASPGERWKEIEAAEAAPAYQIELLKAFVQDFPDHAAGWRRLGSELTELSRFDEALAALQRAQNLADPRYLVFVYCDMGQLFRHRGDDASAERWFRLAITHDPDDTHGYIYLGGMLARRGRLTDAEDLYRRAVRCGKGCTDEAWHNLGLVLRALERYIDALECFEQALMIDPQFKAARVAKRDVVKVLRMREQREQRV